MGRDSTYPNVILFTATLLPFSSRISSVSTYLKALYLPLLLSHPATPFFSSVVRVSLLATRLFSPLLLPRARPRRVPSALLPPPTSCPAHRALLAIVRSRFLLISLPLTPSLFDRLANAKDRQRGIDREGNKRGNERANGGAGSLWSCATRTSQPRATVARQPRCPLKGSFAIDTQSPRFPSSASRYFPVLPVPLLPREHRALGRARFGVTCESETRVRSPTRPPSDRHS